MFNINDGGFHVYYHPDHNPQILYINGEQHNVPQHVHKNFPYLTVIDKEVYINGYVYDQIGNSWHLSAAKKFINIVLITLFVAIMFTIFT